MTKETFEKMMVTFFKQFPHKHIDLEVCWECLKDISDVQFVESIRKILVTTKEIYPNTNIIALIRENSISKNMPLPADAWNEVLAQISSVGSWGNSVFSHPAIKRAVDGIGWRTICQSQNISIERAHFYKLYDQIIEREKKEIMESEGLIESKEAREAIEEITKRALPEVSVGVADGND